MTGPESVDEAEFVAPEVDALLLDSGRTDLFVAPFRGDGDAKWRGHAGAVLSRRSVFDYG